jgi:hypothetical protein
MVPCMICRGKLGGIVLTGKPTRKAVRRGPDRVPRRMILALACGPISVPLTSAVSLSHATWYRESRRQNGTVVRYAVPGGKYLSCAISGLLGSAYCPALVRATRSSGVAHRLRCSHPGRGLDITLTYGAKRDHQKPDPEQLRASPLTVGSSNRQNRHVDRSWLVEVGS